MLPSEVPKLATDSPVRTFPGVLGAALYITDKMEARPQTPLLILQAQSRDEGVQFSSVAQ